MKEMGQITSATTDCSHQIAKARGEGVRALMLSENGVGVALAGFTAAQLQQLLQVDRHYGGDIMLSDALARAGLVTR